MTPEENKELANIVTNLNRCLDTSDPAILASVLLETHKALVNMLKDQ